MLYSEQLPNWYIIAALATQEDKYMEQYMCLFVNGKNFIHMCVLACKCVHVCARIFYNTMIHTLNISSKICLNKQNNPSMFKEVGREREKRGEKGRTCEKESGFWLIGQDTFLTY